MREDLKELLKFIGCCALAFVLVEYLDWIVSIIIYGISQLLLILKSAK